MELIGQRLAGAASKYQCSKRIRAKCLILSGSVCAGDLFECFVGISRAEARVRRVDAILDAVQ